MGNTSAPPTTSRIVDEAQLCERFPLTYNYIHTFDRGKGGAWYIPPEWLPANQAPPRTIIEAAQLASKAAASNPERRIPFSNIPLLVHQKWDTTQLNGTKESILTYVEQWLMYSITPPAGANPMAYFLWDNEGVLELMEEYENDQTTDFIEVFSPVEKVDIFRIVACKWFGGIYGDIDTKPLQHPSQWIRSTDLSEWTDELTGKTYGAAAAAAQVPQDPSQAQPVNAIWGIECDTDPDTNTHWRSSYTYPVQLTNWALASAPQHPILQYFLDRIPEKAAEARHRAAHTPGVSSLAELHYDPVTRTGPVAVTQATSWFLEQHDGLRWNALTGLKDGGKNKVVGDVLILPITGFSPTTKKFNRNGKGGWDHPDARLAHTAMGSWHHTNLIVEYGKFCRSVFGLCKDWQKMW
ncbi:glycosyltransferase family 32 [Trichoderma reesei QM6a]|uniref:Glycosyltransferase family 32 n=1 Tax=Hypocrea jecorina (strain QM6a) TaxID=431241 RepID=G0RP09_HYPJQ|nr:glycosyltransferase family 32 [Trichoderma reesei QM6a]EGR47005.1 glycosyltransferase family 32 [Trichoderma reesei QM6a]